MRFSRGKSSVVLWCRASQNRPDSRRRLAAGARPNGIDQAATRRFAGAENNTRRRFVGHTSELSAGHLRADERVLEERPEGTVAVRRHPRPFEERHQTARTGQPVAQAAGAAGHRRPPEPQENPVRGTAGLGQLLAARRTGRPGRIHNAAAVLNISVFLSPIRLGKPPVSRQRYILFARRYVLDRPT